MSCKKWEVYVCQLRNWLKKQQFFELSRSQLGEDNSLIVHKFHKGIIIRVQLLITMAELLTISIINQNFFFSNLQNFLQHHILISLSVSYGSSTQIDVMKL